MFKNKIYKYYFYEFINIFVLISLSLSILIWMTQAARLLELITEYGNSVPIYIKYVLFMYPKILDNIFLITPFESLSLFTLCIILAFSACFVFIFKDSAILLVICCPDIGMLALKRIVPFECTTIQAFVAPMSIIL